MLNMPNTFTFSSPFPRQLNANHANHHEHPRSNANRQNAHHHPHPASSRNKRPIRGILRATSSTRLRPRRTRRMAPNHRQQQQPQPPPRQPAPPAPHQPAPSSHPANRNPINHDAHDQTIHQTLRLKLPLRLRHVCLFELRGSELQSQLRLRL